MTYRKNLVHQKKSVIKPAVHRSLYVPVCTGEQNLGKFRSLRFFAIFYTLQCLLKGSKRVIIYRDNIIAITSVLRGFSPIAGGLRT